MASSEPLIVTRPSPHVVEVSLNRPSKLNAYSPGLCDALVDTFASLARDTEAYVVVLRGEGKHFCAGLDFGEATGAITPTGEDAARISLKMRAAIDIFQKPCDLLAKLPQVTIACVHGACVGAGVDLAAACDIRYCSEDAKFSIKEVDVGLAADLGSLHRVPMISGNMSWVRELAFTGRTFGAGEAVRFGFASHVAGDEPSLRAAAGELARTIAAKSPVALRATKEMCCYAEAHTPDECLHYVKVLNSAMLQTRDLPASVKAFMTKQPPKYSKL
jgi:enoyl-CoA hydratase/carnithine racemase